MLSKCTSNSKEEFAFPSVVATLLTTRLETVERLEELMWKAQEGKENGGYNGKTFGANNSARE